MKICFLIASLTMIVLSPSALAHSGQTPPPATTSQSIEAVSCEAWIDKAAAEVVAFSSDTGPVFRTRIYLKIDTHQIPLSTLAHVSWYGRRFTWHEGTLASTSDFQRVELRLLESARDYFVLDLGSLSEQLWNHLTGPHQRVSHEGAFVVATTDGRSVWVNDGLRPLANFAFDDSLETLLRAKGQTVGSYGLAVKQSLEQVNLTADVLPQLNPRRCR